MLLAWTGSCDGLSDSDGYKLEEDIFLSLCCSGYRVSVGMDSNGTGTGTGNGTGNDKGNGWICYCIVFRSMTESVCEKKQSERKEKKGRDPVLLLYFGQRILPASLYSHVQI